MDQYRVGAWIVSVEWPTGPGQRNPASLTITPAPDGDPQEIARGVSTTVLRQIDIAGWAAEREEIDRGADYWGEVSGTGPGDFAVMARPVLTDLYLAMLSRTYVNLVNNGDTSPSKTIAFWSGIHQATLKGHLIKARRRDLLTSAEGKTGGELTDKALRILNEGK